MLPQKNISEFSVQKSEKHDLKVDAPISVKL